MSRVLLCFFPAVFFLHGCLTLFAAGRAVDRIAGGIAGEGEEPAAGLALPRDLMRSARTLALFLFRGQLPAAVFAERGHEAPGGIDGEGLPAFFTGFLQLFGRGGRRGRFRVPFPRGTRRGSSPAVSSHIHLTGVISADCRTFIHCWIWSSVRVCPSAGKRVRSISLPRQTV